MCSEQLTIRAYWELLHDIHSIMQIIIEDFFFFSVYVFFFLFLFLLSFLLPLFLHFWSFFSKSANKLILQPNHCLMTWFVAIFTQRRFYADEDLNLKKKKRAPYTHTLIQSCFFFTKSMTSIATPIFLMLLFGRCVCVCVCIWCVKSLYLNKKKSFIGIWTTFCCCCISTVTVFVSTIWIFCVYTIPTYMRREWFHFFLLLLLRVIFVFIPYNKKKQNRCLLIMQKK